MSHRKKRLEKLMTLRAKEVDNRLAKLAEGRTREEQAKRLVEQEEARLVRAREERAEAISGPFAVTSLTLSNDWMVSCARRCELAGQILEKARRGVIEAQAQVVTARNELRKIELIFARMAAEERVRAERVEQQITDEFAALRVAATEKRRGET